MAKTATTGAGRSKRPSRRIEIIRATREGKSYWWFRDVARNGRIRYNSETYRSRFYCQKEAMDLFNDLRQGCAEIVYVDKVNKTVERLDINVVF